MVLISYFAPCKFWRIFFIAILKTKLFYHHLSKVLFTDGGGGPQVGEVTCLGVVTRQSIYSLILI